MRPRSYHPFLIYATIILLALAALSACTKSPAPAPENQAADSVSALTTATIPAQDTEEVAPSATQEPTSEPSPEATATEEATATYTPQATVPSKVKFSINNAQKELPENFMEQITYFGRAGGGGGGEKYNPCEDFQRGVPSYKYEPTENTCLYCGYSLSTCGWNPNEKVRITVQLRGRDSFKTTEQADEFGYLDFYLPPSADDLPGDYTIALNGQNGKLKTTFFKDAPTKTGTFLDGDQLVLYNFVPLEKIRLTIYQFNETKLDIATSRGDQKFIGWQDYQIDADGNLRVQIDLGPDTSVQYLIDAEKSGIYPRTKYTNTATNEVTTYYASFGCNNRESKFTINDSIRVIAPEGAPFFKVIKDYSDPDQVIPSGETGQITGGPHCFEGWIYWQVTLADNRTGWMPQEAYNVEKYFEAVK